MKKGKKKNRKREQQKNRMKYASLLLLAFLSLTKLAHAQSDYTPYTLPSCLEIVLDNAYAIKFARNSD